MVYNTCVDTIRYIIFHIENVCRRYTISRGIYVMYEIELIFGPRDKNMYDDSGTVRRVHDASRV